MYNICLIIYYIEIISEMRLESNNNVLCYNNFRLYITYNL